MQKFWFWLKSCLASRKIKSSDSLVRVAESRLSKSIKKLEKKRKVLKSLLRRVETVGESLQEDLDDSVSIQKQYEEALAAEQSELRVLREVTLPTLTSQHKLLLEMYDAEIAIQVRRQVAMNTNRDVEV